MNNQNKILNEWAEYQSGRKLSVKKLLMKWKQIFNDYIENEILFTWL